MQYKNLPDTLKEKTWLHNYSLAETHFTLEKGPAGSFWYASYGSPAGESIEPNRPPIYDTDIELYLLMPDKLTVADVNIVSAIKIQHDKAHRQAMDESWKMVPSPKLFSNSIDIVNSKGETVGCRCVPEPDHECFGGSRNTWIRRRTLDILSNSPPKVSRGAKVTHGHDWFPEISVIVEEIIVDRKCIEGVLEKLVSRNLKGWRGSVLPPDFYLAGGYDVALIKSRIEQPEYAYGPWFVPEMAVKFVELTGYSVDEVMSALRIPDSAYEARPETILPDGNILPDEPDELWEELETLSDKIKINHHDTFPIPEGVFGAES